MTSVLIVFPRVSFMVVGVGVIGPLLSKNKTCSTHVEVRMETLVSKCPVSGVKENWLATL